ncbi:MAG: type II toxin-antitoxin system HicB family antitoxin [Dysgonamonadaceae bacterium]|jgi:predicted RNase H-like HicB family nuclease|nr:type II toxin-antitoxin system HicB family antitoxin [Dysgonamonadaceae bacterium]
MDKIIITVGASADHFGAYAENCPGIYGAGDTPEAAKQNALEGLNLLIKHSEKEDLPNVLKGEYCVVYRYDTQSFLKHYNSIFTNVALERLTGINQKLLHHYSTGLKKPRPAQRKKIESALHQLGQELLAVEL